MLWDVVKKSQYSKGTYSHNLTFGDSTSEMPLPYNDKRVLIVKKYSKESNKNKQDLFKRGYDMFGT